MLFAVVQNVFVDLVGDRDDVPLVAEVGDRLKLFAGKDLAGRIVRRVDDDRLGVRVEGGGQLIGIEVSSPACSVTKRGVAPDRIASGP